MITSFRVGGSFVAGHLALPLVNQLTENTYKIATSQRHGRSGSAAIPASVTKVFLHFLRYDYARV